MRKICLASDLTKKTLAQQGDNSSLQSIKSIKSQQSQLEKELSLLPRVHLQFCKRTKFLKCCRNTLFVPQTNEHFHPKLKTLVFALSVLVYFTNFHKEVVNLDIKSN